MRVRATQSTPIDATETTDDVAFEPVARAPKRPRIACEHKSKRYNCEICAPLSTLQKKFFYHNDTILHSQNTQQMDAACLEKNGATHTQILTFLRKKLVYFNRYWADAGLGDKTFELHDMKIHTIMPMRRAISEEHIRTASHFTNLQLVPRTYNIGRERFRWTSADHNFWLTHIFKNPDFLYTYLPGDHAKFKVRRPKLNPALGRLARPPQLVFEQSTRISEALRDSPDPATAVVPNRIRSSLARNFHEKTHHALASAADLLSNDEWQLKDSLERTREALEAGPPQLASPRAAAAPTPATYYNGALARNPSDMDNADADANNNDVRRATALFADQDAGQPLEYDPAARVPAPPPLFTHDALNPNRFVISKASALIPTGGFANPVLPASALVDAATELLAHEYKWRALAPHDASYHSALAYLKYRINVKRDMLPIVSLRERTELAIALAEFRAEATHVMPYDDIAHLDAELPCFQHDGHAVFPAPGADTVAEDDSFEYTEAI